MQRKQESPNKTLFLIKNSLCRLKSLRQTTAHDYENAWNQDSRHISKVLENRRPILRISGRKVIYIKKSRAVYEADYQDESSQECLTYKGTQLTKRKYIFLYSLNVIFYL